MGFRHQIHNRCLNSSDDEEEIIIPSHILQMSKIAHSFNPIWGKNGEDEPVYVCRKKSHAFNIQGVVDSSMKHMLTKCN